MSWIRNMTTIAKELTNGEERGERWVQENFYNKIEDNNAIGKEVIKRQ